MTKGWCPRHDRLFESASGLCPECGTALVDLSAPRRDDESRLVVEEDEPAPLPTKPPLAAGASLWPDVRLPERFFGRNPIAIGPAAIAAILIAAVVVSFLVGLAIPRGLGGATAEAPTTPQARGDYRVGVDREGAGVALRLERVSQRGRRVVLRVAIDPNGPIGSGSIDVLTVSLVAGGDGQVPTEFGPVRATTTGFVAEGEVRDGGKAVTGVRIQSLRASVTAPGVDVPVNLSRVVGVGRSPRTSVFDVEEALSYGRTLDRVTLIGWPDGIEARFDIRGERPDWSYDDGIALDIKGLEPTEGSVLDQNNHGVRYVMFGVPASTSRPIITIRPRTVTVHGNWAWELGPSG